MNLAESRTVKQVGLKNIPMLFLVGYATMADEGTGAGAGSGQQQGNGQGAGSGASQSQNSTAGQQQQTSGGDGKNTAAGQSGAGTGTAQIPAQQTDITQSAEFKAAVTAAIEKKLPQLRKQIAKEVSGEKDGQPTVEELQQRSEAAERDLNFYKARDQVEDFVADKKNSVSVRNMKALIKYFKDDFEFTDGKVTNLKEILTRAKIETPELLGTVTGSIDAGAGNNNQPSGNDMNAMIRRAAGRQT